MCVCVCEGKGGWGNSVCCTKEFDYELGCQDKESKDFINDNNIFTTCGTQEGFGTSLLCPCRANDLVKGQE